MLNSINPNQSFGSTVTILEKVTDGPSSKIVKTLIKNTDTKNDEVIRKVLSGFQPESGVKKVSGISSFINDTLSWFTKTNINPDAKEGIWLAKIDENRFVYGNRDNVKNGTIVNIDLNA